MDTTAIIMPSKRRRMEMPCRNKLLAAHFMPGYRDDGSVIGTSGSLPHSNHEPS
jgi:hypothetical protein